MIENQFFIESNWVDSFHKIQFRVGVIYELIIKDYLVSYSIQSMVE